MTQFGYRTLGFGSGGGAAPYEVEWLVIAGGGSGSDWTACGGGGAGGYRIKYASETSGGGTNTESVLSLSPGTQYTITVGAGGVAPASGIGLPGEDSSISGADITTITSIGGGTGTYINDNTGVDGGSGGGGAGISGMQTPGSGTANQGYDGGTAVDTGHYNGAGGGGATAVGGSGTVGSGGNSGAGGDGLASSITASSVARGGGGGGGTYNGTPGAGGLGGGGVGAASGGNTAGSGTANTGGGGGSTDGTAGSGGSGVVILRMADANYSGTTTGSPTIAQNQGDGSDETIITFNDDGTYTG